MIIEKYSDLEKVEDGMIVDLTKLSPRMSVRALDFLAGLTFRNGSLKKIEKDKYLVKIND